jgi:hypothetical protein
MGEKLIDAVSDLLDHGNCEPFKAGVHAAGLVLASLCALYNTAAWLKRRERHLAINAIVYGAAVWVERCHVVEHMAACRPVARTVETPAPNRELTAA